MCKLCGMLTNPSRARTEACWTGIILLSTILMQARCMDRLHERVVVKSVAKWEPSSSQHGSPYRSRLGDPACIRRLLKPDARDPPARRARVAAANSAALRLHFGELTGALLQPFTTFWRPVGPPPGTGPVPVQGAPHLPPFSHTDFLVSLAQQPFPPVLLERFGNQVGCYLTQFHALLQYQA